MSAVAPSKASGTVTLGMIVAHRLRRKTKITITTSATVSISVNCTSCTEARIVWVRSLMVEMWMVGGIASRSCGSAFWILSTVSMTLAPGWPKITRKMPFLPSAQASCLASCGPTTAWPISRTRSGPLLL